MRTPSQHRMAAASLARPDSPPPSSGDPSFGSGYNGLDDDGPHSGGRLATPLVSEGGPHEEPDGGDSIAGAERRPSRGAAWVFFGLAGVWLLGLGLHYQLSDPADVAAPRAAVRLMRVQAVPDGAEVSYGNLSQRAPASFVVPAGGRITVRLTLEDRAKEFQVEVPQGDDVFEQTLVLEP